MELGTCTDIQVTSTRSRKFLPALKCGTYLAGIMTVAPDFGLRPLRGGWWFRLKLPNPRTSTLPPLTKLLEISSRMTRTVNSIRCLWR